MKCQITSHFNQFSVVCPLYLYRVGLSVFNATLNNIVVISWATVLMAEEARVPEGNHRTATSH